MIKKLAIGLSVSLAVASAATVASASILRIEGKTPVTALEQKVQRLAAQGAPAEPTRIALQYFYAHPDYFPNKRYVTVIDMTMHSSQDRFFLIEMATEKVTSYVVAHGRGSDPNWTGYAQVFSNQPSSKATSIGFYRVAETYQGSHGYSVRMDGLSATNSKARERAIVIHGASYVQRGLEKQGRSFGCPALDDNVSTSVIQKVKEGSLLYLHGDPQLEDDISFE